MPFPLVFRLWSKPMPCRSDYMEPSHEERYLKKTAKLIIYVLQKIDGVVPEWIKEQSENYYSNDKRLVPFLCDLLKGLNHRQTELIVYNAKDRTSRALADWWEDHQEADAKREAEEALEKAKEAAREKAYNSLTEEEKKLLGYKL